MQVTYLAAVGYEFKKAPRTISVSFSRTLMEPSGSPRRLSDDKEDKNPNSRGSSSSSSSSSSDNNGNNNDNNRL